MSSSLTSALSGMRAHQQWIDLIGNNLANTNTVGYKGVRGMMSSSFAQTLRFASAPTAVRGGVDPMQVGLGVHMGTTDRIFSQGSLTSTGRIFDLALEGSGFFTLSDGGRNFYSRAGTFGLDVDHNLVDQRTGLRVLNGTGQTVNIDTDALFPPQETANVDMKGNLPAVVTGPLAEVLTSNVGLEEGFPATLTGTETNFAVTAGATYSMEIVLSGGAPMPVVVTDSDNDGAFTAAEIATAIDNLDDVSALVNGAGQIEVSSDRTGDDVTLKINPGSPNDLASVIGLSTALVSGSQQVNPAADLNTLPANLADYVVGDQIDIAGVDTDGSPINGTFTYGAGNDGTSIQDLIDFMDGLYSDASVSLNASGQIVVEAQTAGEADLLLTIADAGTSTGSTEWSTYGVSVTTEGTPPDEVVTSTEAYDNAGVAHTLTLTMQRQADGTWNIVASIPASDGTVLTGGSANPITGLTFDENGAPQGLGSVASTVVVQFNGQTGPQSMDLDLGTDGQFDGLTQFGGLTTAYVSGQDGYGDGVLANLAVNQDATIEGFYTNGQTRILGNLGIATFQNQGGLHQEGESYFTETVNSGTANIGAGGVQGAGAVIGGALEDSNVDTAQQFVRLIQAQRGFQANARVVTTQDEVLAEVVNLI